MAIEIYATSLPLDLLDVEAIALSSNNDLIPGTGTTGRLRRIAGEQVDAQCARILDRLDEPLKQGDVVVTDGGALTEGDKRTHLLHAITTYYGSDEQGQRSRAPISPETIAEAVRN